MNEEERLAAERVSCAAAGGLLLIAGGALVWGACLRGTGFRGAVREGAWTGW